ncbi:IS21-like element helper ATPase IstB [Candidatus Babeliales bacterium]|nr:IS21-like element helper ATPase IstB [Candidatus Babeliales bacterium]
MEKLICERIQNNLQRLKLVRIGEVLDKVSENSQNKQVSYLEFLDHLLEEEVAAKETRRIRSAMQTAGLPFAKTIEEYDFLFHPQLDKKLVMNLFDLTFLSSHENAIFLGPPGVGKTHLAVALAIKACNHGFSVHFTTMNTLMEKLKLRQSRSKHYMKAKLVVVDEIGYSCIDRMEAHLFFQFVSYRYERSSTIVTSNKSFSDWQEFFGDPIIATAILDRLLHHCHIVNIKGRSYRLKHLNAEYLLQDQEEGETIETENS